MTIEIVIFALIAGFVALRLFSVLGSRPDDDAPPAKPSPRDVRDMDEAAKADAPTEVRDPFEGVEDADVRAGLEQIARADRSFDYASFKEGATAAYEMILEGFWNGERAAYEPYVSTEIAADFNAALEQRQRDGHVVENRLIDLDDVSAVEASLSEKVAEITMAFKGNIMGVTRDADGDIIDGSASDTYQTNDRWTFTRKIGSRDPNWTVIATEIGPDEDDEA